MEEDLVTIVFIALFCLAILIGVINKIWRYIVDTPKRRILREQRIEVKELLNGFDARKERTRIIRLLEDSLPSAYRCGRKGCGGVLLKRNGYYVCSRCHNFRSTIRMPKTVRWITSSWVLRRNCHSCCNSYNKVQQLWKTLERGWTHHSKRNARDC